VAYLYHVAPYDTWIKQIRKEGLVPQAKKRGLYSDSDEPRVYLFEDADTALDALANWLLDEYDDVRWFALLEVDVPKGWLHEDPEIAGSYYVRHPVHRESVRIVKKIDGGYPVI
jgi:hypothetical protein